MDTRGHARLALLAEVWKVLVAPVIMLAVGLGTFVYEVAAGGDQAFATMGLALAATGAGLGADLLGKKASL